jgi:hypothetical protein
MPVSSSGTYDPWLDYNEDGIIDLKDVYPMHQAYSTLGDPTKNVNVTNWPPLDKYLIIDLGTLNMTAHDFSTACPSDHLCNSAGYSRLSLFYDTVAMGGVGPFNVTISLESILWYVDGWSVFMWDNTNSGGFNTTLHYDGSGYSAHYASSGIAEILGPYFQLKFQTETTKMDFWNYWVVIHVYAYLRNE